jgi:hypothetical protein
MPFDTIGCEKTPESVPPLSDAFHARCRFGALVGVRLLSVPKPVRSLPPKYVVQSEDEVVATARGGDTTPREATARMIATPSTTLPVLRGSVVD